ncbi:MULTISPECIES: GTP cyclohydrolase FolE2 [Desulfosediminicola]|uniref:GTP cyclohydrolase FolE2 n=1 Tax=Desulfosediminicola TaxID=2886823 RepID=UPI0010AD378F|nr:GTP cyclohydrolase FolE2 [Desulfosediminicola ganghwensis]
MHIQAVGINNIHTPVKVLQKGGGLQHTIATISMQAKLPSSKRESCVETFTSILNQSLDELSWESFGEILREVQSALGSQSARLEMTFPYFIEKKAPVTETRSLMEYSCTFSGGIGEAEGLTLSVAVPVTTLCPCSKEISQHGAHNQRAEVKLNVEMKKFVWIEDLISLVEQSASCELYALLKRPDEKYVTERAFNNPMFVEDVVRKVAESAMAHPEIDRFSASVESFESIHKHSAYAYVDSDEIR